MKRILMLEDDIAFASTLSRQLQRKGYEVQHINEVSLLLATSHQWQPDFVLLDRNLDGESSLNTLPALRAALPHARIIIVTGYASIATTVKAMKTGADDYLPKPITLDALLCALEGKPSSQENMQTMSPDRLEWEHIQKTLSDHNGNISATARALGMHRRTLQRKLAKRPASQ